MDHCCALALVDSTGRKHDEDQLKVQFSVLTTAMDAIVIVVLLMR